MLDDHQSTHPPASPSPPLDARTLSLTTERLRSALGALIAEFPQRARSMGGMARWLGVSKASAQRLVEALTPTHDPTDALRRLPGTAALTAIVTAAERRGVDPAHITRARAAIDQYAVLVRTHARSQRAFNQLLSVGVGQAAPRLPTRAERRALHAAAVAVSGESLGVKSVIAFVDPSPSSPNNLRVRSLVSLLEARRRTFARPLVASLIAGWWSNVRTERASTRTDVGAPAAEVVEPLCTAPVRPVPVVSADAHTALLIDFPDTPDAEGWLGPLDVAMWFAHDRVNHPLTDPRARLSAAARIHQPTRLLVHDIFLHRSLADHLRPRVSAVSMVALPGDLPGVETDALWFERFPDATDIQRLPPGLAPCPGCQRHLKLTQHAVERAGINTDDFEVFRCRVEFPAWQLEYRVDFPPI